MNTKAVYLWLMYTTLPCLVTLTGCQCRTSFPNPRTKPDVETRLRVDLPMETQPTLVFKDNAMSTGNLATFHYWSEGPDKLIIKEIRFVGKDTNVFKLFTQPFPIPVGPNQANQNTITVRFSPRSLRRYQAKILFGYAYATRPNRLKWLTVQLRNEVFSPIPAFLCKHQLHFGAIQPGTQKELGCIVENRGKNTLIIHKVSVEANKELSKSFQLLSPSKFPYSIQPNQSIELVFLFRPTGPLSRESKVRYHFHTNIPNETPKTRHFIKLIGKTNETKAQVYTCLPEQDSYQQFNRPLLDLLIIIDDSNNMARYQQDIIKGFRGFARWLVRLNIDFRVGVISTDMSGKRFKAGCLLGKTKKILTPLDRDFIEQFEANTKLESAKRTQNQAFEAALQAFSNSNLSGCNKGFFRSNSHIALLFVSGNPEGSPRTMAYYTDKFRKLRAPNAQDLIRTSTISGSLSGCRNKSVSAKPTPRFYQMAKLFGGVRLSICSAQWVGMSTGTMTYGYRHVFYLSKKTLAKHIQVKVDGKIIPQSPIKGWQYQKGRNAVFFEYSNHPPPGSKIDITYRYNCPP